MAHKHSVYDTDPHFSINPATRVIKNESTTKTCVIQHDHNSERFTFEIPRFVDGHDMSLCNLVQVHYINIETATQSQNAGIYEAQDVQVFSDKDGEFVIFSWLISRNATQFVGSLNFLIRFACVSDGGVVDYVWNTGIHSGISVSTGMDNTEDVSEEYPDILAQWRQELFEAGGDAVVNVNTAKDNAISEIEAKGAETMDSIPEDYTDMLHSVNKNNEVNSRNSKRITNLEQGFLPSMVDVDDTVAYVKDVPTGAPPFAEVLEVGGMTRKCTNLIPFPYRHTDKTENGITWTVNADGTVTANGTATAESKFITGYFTIKANQSYTYTGCPKGGSETTYFVKASGFGNDVGNGRNISCPYDFESTQILTICSGYTANNLVFKPMVNEGESALPYEPYFEGLGSAPVTELESVGANLLDLVSFANSSVTATENDDGSVTFKNTINSFATTLKTMTGQLPAGTYTLTHLMGSTVYWQTSGSDFANGLLKGESKTFTYDGTSYLRIILADFNANASVTYKLMLNRGSTAQPFSPYVRYTLPIPAEVQALDGYGVGANETYYNYIDWKDKVFIKNCHHVIADGVTIKASYQASGVPYAFQIGAIKKAQAGMIMMCDKLPIITYDRAAQGEAGVYTTSGGVIFVSLGSDSGIETVNACNAHWQSDPLSLVYVLATPEITDISDLITADNMLGVGAGGTVTFVNEHCFAVPSKLTCKPKTV